MMRLSAALSDGVGPQHHAVVLKLWSKAKDVQLDLLDMSPASAQTSSSDPRAPQMAPAAPQMLPIASLYEDSNNPRTEFPEAELNELAEDICQHGILQPIVVHPADAQRRHCIHFGAKRWRAAQRAGLTEVPVVVRDAPADPYTQVAENQKRHGLSPLDLARFVRVRADAGDSNATIAKRLGMDSTTVAHHLALLELPPVLNEAMHTGRCTSPRTLHELSKLHSDEPSRVKALLEGNTEITRAAVNAVRAQSLPTPTAAHAQHPASPLLAQAGAECGRLERTLGRLVEAEPRLAAADLALLRQRVASLASRLA